MRRIFIAVMLALSAGVPAGAADETPAGLPIETLFPDYVVMEETDLDPEMVAYVRRQDPAYRDRSLTEVTVDLDGNGLEDHAAIIRARDSSQGGLVVVLQTGDGRFRAVHKEFFGGVPDFMFLIRVEAGQKIRQTEAIDVPTKTAVLQQPGIELVFFEKASVVYYWNSEARKIDEIWTSD